MARRRTTGPTPAERETWGASAATLHLPEDQPNPQRQELAATLRAAADRLSQPTLAAYPLQPSEQTQLGQVAAELAQAAQP